MNVRSITAIVSAAVFAMAIGASLAPGQQKQPETIKIGVANSMFRDLSDAKIDTLIPDFEALLQDQTGFKGEVVKTDDAGALGKKLNDKAVQLGVFQGFEFAWARQSYPKLKPLIIAVQRQRNLKACIVVLDDNKATSLANLKGKVLSIPKRSPEHCHLFLERELGAMKVSQKDFFAKVVDHPNPEDALDDILRKKVDAVLVDG
ncbi:MAG TPA: PhnD/SsuA/transferrin family substrate-binding protein, partial [Gemmataceae bacterium]|nr:PhnD/SsuA/transferrin family substrate-binding protein [Gemmataceae bacterium]